MHITYAAIPSHRINFHTYRRCILKVCGGVHHGFFTVFPLQTHHQFPWVSSWQVAKNHTITIPKPYYNDTITILKSYYNHTTTQLYMEYIPNLSEAVF
jgi:hypothetical protein